MSVDSEKLPRVLHAGYLMPSGVYRLNWTAMFSGPPVLLKLLKQDVATLEEAGVKEEDE